MKPHTPTELIGYLDGLRAGVWISGWARSLPNSDEPARVLVYRDGQIIARVFADQPRSDVAATLGTARTNYGFLIDLRTLAQTVDLNAGDSLNFIVEGRPEGFNSLSKQPLILPPQHTNLRCRGSFDGVGTDGLVYGWASNTTEPSERLTIHFLVEDVLVGTAETGLNRQDVMDAGLGSLESGFHAPVSTDLRLNSLHPGAKLVAAFDESGLLPLDGGELVLDGPTIDRLLLGSIKQIEREASSISLHELLELFGTTNLRELLNQNDKARIFSGVAQRQIALTGPADIVSVLESSSCKAVFSESVLELELLRLYALLLIDETGRIDEERINSSFLDYFHSLRDVDAVERDFKSLLDLLKSLYRQFAVRTYGASSIKIAAPFQKLTRSIARWIDRILHDSRLALDFLEAIPGAHEVETAVERDVVLAAKLYRQTGSNAKALALLSSTVTTETRSWWLCHEFAVLMGLLIREQPGLAVSLLPEAIHHFSRALALNPQQNLSEREAWKLLRDVQTLLLAQSNDAISIYGIEAAVGQRGHHVDLLTAQCMAIAGVGSVEERPAALVRWTDLSRRKVLLWGSRQLFQCFYYRVKQKIDSLNGLDYETDYLDVTEQAKSDWRRKLFGVSVIFACRIPATLHEVELFAYAKSLSIPIIYDIDDLIFDFSAFPPSFESYAGTIDQALHHHLALDNPFFHTGLRLADRVTVSTMPLLQEVRKHIDQSIDVTVLPNLLSHEVLFLAERVRPSYLDQKETGSRLVLFYGSATKAHKQAFYDIFLPAVIDILDRYDFVDLHLVGYFSRLPAQYVTAGRIRQLEPTEDYLGYLRLLRKADINISVLEHSRATDSKSEIKWLEAAAFGIPSVVSPTQAYRDALTAGRDALFAETQAEWREQLSLLVERPEMRSNIGKAARALALDRFHPDVAAPILEEVLADFLPVPQPRRRKRILVANVFFAPQSVGGATRVAEMQVRGLTSLYADEFEVFVLTTHTDPHPSRPYGVEQYWHEGVLVTRLHVPSKEWSDYNDSKVATIFEELCQCYEFDLIHMHSIQVLTASIATIAKSLRIPYIVTLHDAWWLSRYLFLVDEFGNQVDPLDPLSGGKPSNARLTSTLLERARMLREILATATAVLAVSGKFGTLYRDAGVANVQIHENAIEPVPIVRRLRERHEDIVLGFIGGMSRHKGFHLFRQALEQGNFPRLSAIVVDHDLDAGESYRTVWGESRVEFISKTKQKDIGELYGRLDVLVAPSIWPESYGLVTREALQAGVWVIASDRGAIGDCIVEGVNGNIVDVRDHVALQAALAALPAQFAGSADRQRQSETVSAVSVRDHLDSLTAFYRATLKRH